METLSILAMVMVMAAVAGGRKRRQQAKKLSIARLERKHREAQERLR